VATGTGAALSNIHPTRAADGCFGTGDRPSRLTLIAFARVDQKSVTTGSVHSDACEQGLRSIDDKNRGFFHETQQSHKKTKTKTKTKTKNRKTEL
jgi:hypothetical protein